MTPINIQIPALAYGSQWSHVFQNQNTQWLTIFESRVIQGNFFLGLQAQWQHAFNAQIPPGSTILSARLRMTAFQNSTPTPQTVRINTPDRDGVDRHRKQPLLLPFEPFRGWRQDQWTNFGVNVFNDVLANVASTAGGALNNQWIIKQITAPGATLANREEIGQRFQLAGAENISAINWNMYRTGAPIGDIRCRIEGATSVFGVLEPDGNVLATSAGVLATSLPVGVGAATDITFAFAPNVALAAGTPYFAILETDYDDNNADYVVARNRNAFLTTGLAMHYGDGLGYDWQNFPGTVDVNQAHHIAGGDLSTDVDWVVPQIFAGGAFDSPDVTDIVQDQINEPWYTQDAGIILTGSQLVPTTINRIWRSAAFAPATSAQLFVEYEPPADDPFGGGTGKGHGAYIMEPREESDTIRRDQNAIHAALAAVAIREYYE